MDLPLTFEDDQEQDIDQMISDAVVYGHNQGMEEIPEDIPPIYSQTGLPYQEQLMRREEHERNRKNNVWRRKQMRIRALISSLNCLAASLLATISVAERQIAVLQNLHDLFFTSCRTEIKGPEKGYPLRGNPFYKNIAPIPILSEISDQIWANTLGAIDEVVRERQCFMKKVRKLVESMDIRRKIV